MKKLLLLFLVSSIASLTASGTCPELEGYRMREHQGEGHTICMYGGDCLPLRCFYDEKNKLNTAQSHGNGCPPTIE